MNIVEPEIFDDNKPCCVLGILTTENGKVIADELYEMLKPKYNVYKVEQAPPGKEYEYPAIRFAIDLCKNKKLKQILYVHTKGAVNTRPIAIQVRRGLWRQEFIDNIDWYLNACDTNNPIVACPATNRNGTTWYNGFFMNLSACEKVILKKDLRNRYYYEHIFNERVNKGIKVVGRVFNNIAEETYSTTHKQLNSYIMNLNIATNDIKNKRVIYTCVTGGYENIVPPTYVQPDFNYVCFTDNMEQQTSVWELRPIPEELKDLTPVKQQRIIKICPHRYLPEYDESIWVDGSIDILSDLNNFISKHCKKEGKSVFMRKHPTRNCIYSEANTCISIKKDTKEHIQPQMDKYKKEGFPKNYGLVESNVIYRKHNDPYCIKLMDRWALEIINGSHRDQLSFNYALWKTGTEGFVYINISVNSGGYFKWYVGHNRKSTNGVKKKVINNNTLQVTSIGSNHVSKNPYHVATQKMAQERKRMALKRINHTHRRGFLR